MPLVKLGENFSFISAAPVIGKYMWGISLYNKQILHEFKFAVICNPDTFQLFSVLPYGVA